MFIHLVQRVGLVVSVDLEHHGLALDVLDERPGDRNRDVLNVVEVERGALAGVLHRLCGEGFVVPVQKTAQI